MSTESATVTVIVKRVRGYVHAACSCSWVGPLNPARFVEAFGIAKREADQHRYAHDHNLGFFDHQRGWIPAEGTSE